MTAPSRSATANPSASQAPTAVCSRATATPSTTAPHEQVDRLPDPDLAHADQQLGVLGLGEHVVEGALADVLDHADHARLDHGAADAAHEEVDPDDGQQLVGRPAGQLRGVVEDQGEHGQGGPEGDQRLEQLEEEVDPVLELGQGADPQRQPGQPERPDQLPGPPHQLFTAV
jgi:hypothetical protein